MDNCVCLEHGKHPAIPNPVVQDRLFSGVSGAKPVEPGTTKTSVGKCSRNTHDHTALKGVSDRPERGITQASSTFSVCTSSEWCKGIPPKGRVGLDLSARNRCIHKQASWPAPDRRDIRGVVWVKINRMTK